MKDSATVSRAEIAVARINGPLTKRPNVFGGTPEGQARANVDAWEKVLAFLKMYL
jgi:hypothetical protein